MTQKRGLPRSLPTSRKHDREVLPSKSFLFLPRGQSLSLEPRCLGSVIVWGDLCVHFNSHWMEMEVDVNKRHLADVGKEVCRSRGSPVGEAVNRLGDETMVGFLAFCQSRLRRGAKVTLLEDCAQVFLDRCGPMSSLWLVARSNQNGQRLVQPLLRHFHPQYLGFRALRIHTDFRCVKNPA